MANKLKKILILSEKQSYFCRRLAEEGEKAGVMVEWAKFSQINIRLRQGLVEVQVQGKNILTEYDAFVFRSSKSVYGKLFQNSKELISYLADLNHKKVFNFRNGLLHSKRAFKLYNLALLAANNLPVLPTWNFSSLDELIEFRKELAWPLIVKTTRGSLGEQVKLVKGWSELLEYLSVYPVEMTLLQQYVEKTSDRAEDMRVVCLGAEVIGGYKRVAPAGQIVTNTCAGGTPVPVKLAPDIKQICQKTAELLETDIAGIDIILDDGRPFILEVNRAPHIGDFERITKINLAGKILDYIAVMK